MAARNPSHDGGETLVGNEGPGLEHQQLVKEDPKLGQALKRENAQVSQHTDGAIYLRNTKDDPDAPRAWPTWKKYCVVGLARCGRAVLIDQWAFALISYAAGSIT